VRTLGKMCPYTKMQTGSETFKTKAHEKAGVNPEWNQAFIFNLDGKDQHLHVHVMDEEWGKDGVIGRVDVPLATLATMSGETAFTLNNPSDFKKTAGSLILRTEFKDPTAPQIAPQMATQPAVQVVYQQQPMVMYQQPQPTVIYQQPTPQPTPQQPVVVYQQPVPQQPTVVYQSPPTTVTTSTASVVADDKFRMAWHDGKWNVATFDSFDAAKAKFDSFNWAYAAVCAKGTHMYLGYSGTEELINGACGQLGLSGIGEESVSSSSSYRVIWHQGDLQSASFGSYSEAFAKFDGISSDKTAVARIVLIGTRVVMAYVGGDWIRNILLQGAQ